MLKFSLVFTLIVVTCANAHAVTVTYQASGVFQQDGAAWTAVASWQESAMDGNLVTPDEMDSFVIMTAAGDLQAATYTIADIDLPANLLGFVFDGDTALANLVGYNSLAFSATHPTNSPLQAMTFNQFDFSEVIRDGQGAEIDSRFTVFDSSQLAFTRVTNGPAVPEPTALVLAALGLLSLGMTRRRRRG